MPRRTPDVLSVDELNRLLATLEEPFRTMVVILASTGLSFSELRGLQWGDIDEHSLTLKLKRGVVDGDTGGMKNAASKKPVPITAEVCSTSWSSGRSRPMRATMTGFLPPLPLKVNVPYGLPLPWPTI
jgi:integrase